VRRAFLLAVLGATACSVPALEGEGKRCPCAPGWVCDEVRDECVSVFATRDAGARDGSVVVRDAGRSDAGRLDAGRFDAGRSDAGPDAGNVRQDAGPLGQDAGRDAGGRDSGPPGDCPPGAVYCESFESGIRGTIVGGARLDDARSADGAMSLRSPTFGDYLRAPAAVPDRAALRAWVYWPSTSTGSGEVGLVTAGRDESLHLSGVSLVLNSAGQILGRAGNRLLVWGGPLPRDTWICLEMVADRTTEEMALYVDDTLVFDFVGFDEWTEDGDAVLIGAHEMIEPGGGGWDLGIDGVVLATARIGCR